MTEEVIAPVALVTGANGGLGSGICRSLARHGWSVAVNYVGEDESAIDLARELSSFGPPSIAIRGDVSDPRDVEALVETVSTELGPIHLLVNNAGIGFTADLVDTLEADWDRVLGVNLKGQYLCGRAVVQRMIRSGRGGRIVNIASEVGLMGLEGLTAYATSKAAVVGLTKSWAKELAPYGILVNAVAPGPFDTGMLTDFERSAEYLATIPAGRLGRPEELGELIAFLVGDNGSFFVGQVLSPNGGVLI